MSLDQFRLTFLEGYGFSDFLLDISTMLLGNSDAGVTSYSCTFLGRELDAGLLLLEGYGFTDFLLDISTMLSGNSDADVTSYRCTFLGRE